MVRSVEYLRIVQDRADSAYLSESDLLSMLLPGTESLISGSVMREDRGEFCN